MMNERCTLGHDIADKACAACQDAAKARLEKGIRARDAETFGGDAVSFGGDAVYGVAEFIIAAADRRALIMWLDELRELSRAALRERERAPDELYKAKAQVRDRDALLVSARDCIAKMTEQLDEDVSAMREARQQSELVEAQRDAARADASIAKQFWPAMVGLGVVVGFVIAAAAGGL